ncbi:hypothetical protein [Aeromicrobium massiliense]|uniref:hypothetical protein n=1 Tax=Aeromicrobium massiliense TaxID=1464554 RepID=UPI0002E9178C|nr:hypothetical protein [Aeromicrobium massiliense]
MTPLTRTRSALVSVAALAVLTACSGDDGDDKGAGSGSESSSSSSASPSAPAVDPATGEKAETDAFSFNAPEGWRDVTDQIPGYDPEVAYAATQAQDGFTTNVNVLPEPAFESRSMDEVVPATAKQLENMGFKQVQELEPFTVEGEEAGVISAEASQNAVTYRTRQYFLANDDKGWVVTFSFPASATPDAQAELAESVMSTWSWS